MSGEVGRCGHSGPVFIGSPPVLCRLSHGHAGWHRGDDGSEWNDVRPVPAVPDNAGLLDELVRVCLDWSWEPTLDEPTETQAAQLRKGLAGPLAALLAERDDLAAKVAEVKWLHGPGPGADTDCSACGGIYPCPTARALGGDPS